MFFFETGVSLCKKGQMCICKCNWNCNITSSCCFSCCFLNFSLWIVCFDTRVKSGPVAVYTIKIAAECHISICTIAPMAGREWKEHHLTYSKSGANCLGGKLCREAAVEVAWEAAGGSKHLIYMCTRKGNMCTFSDVVIHITLHGCHAMSKQGPYFLGWCCIWWVSCDKGHFSNAFDPDVALQLRASAQHRTSWASFPEFHELQRFSTVHWRLAYAFSNVWITYAGRRCCYQCLLCMCDVSLANWNKKERILWCCVET